MKNSNIEKALKEAKEQFKKADNDCIKNMIRIFIESLDGIK